MKKTHLILIFLLISLSAYAQDAIVDINDVRFNVVSIEGLDDEIIEEDKNLKFNMAYSPFLPARGIYLAKDAVSGKEAIVQIGFAKVDEFPYNLYLQKNLFDFFSGKDVKLNLKFIGWNKKGESSIYLDLESLVVKPNRSIKEIKKNGTEKYYIQLGAFSFYQNAYPIIMDVMPYLKINTNFYMIQKEIIKRNKKKNMYRVLVGPYSEKTAKEVAKKINLNIKASAFIHSGESILSDKK